MRENGPTTAPSQAHSRLPASRTKAVNLTGLQLAVNKKNRIFFEKQLAFK